MIRRFSHRSWTDVIAVVALLVIAGGVFPLPTWPASVDVGEGNRIVVPLKSVKDLRDQSVVKQGYDYSCGAAAFATLLTYGLGDTISEPEVLVSVLAALSREEETLRKKEGLSLLDLQQVAQARGHKAQGFRLSPEYLAKLRGPVIVFIQPRGYKHFAVLKGLRGDRVYLADPSLGNIRMPLYKFLAMWLDDQGRGIIFVVERKDGQQLEHISLTPPVAGVSQPELLSIREMLEVGNPYARFPELFR